MALTFVAGLLAFSHAAQADAPRWSAPVKIATVTSPVGDASVIAPRVATGPDGTSAIAWFEYVAVSADPSALGRIRVMLSSVSPTGTVRAPIELDSGYSPTSAPSPDLPTVSLGGSPQIAVGPGGAISASWQTAATGCEPGACAQRVKLAQIGADGSLRRETTVTNRGIITVDGPAPAIAIDGASRTWLAWNSVDPGSSEDPSLHATGVTADGERLDDISLGTLPNGIVGTPTIRALEDGNVGVAWANIPAQSTSLVAHFRRISAAGIAGPDLLTSSVPSWSETAQLAIGGDGSLVGASNDYAFGEIQRMAPDGTVSAPIRYSSSLYNLDMRTTVDRVGRVCTATMIGSLYANGVYIDRLDPAGFPQPRVAMPASSQSLTYAQPGGVAQLSDGSCAFSYTASTGAIDSSSSETLRTGLALAIATGAGEVTDVTRLVDPAGMTKRDFVISGSQPIDASPDNVVTTAWTTGSWTETSDGRKQGPRDIWVSRHLPAGAGSGVRADPIGAPLEDSAEGPSRGPSGPLNGNPYCQGLSSALCLQRPTYATSSNPGAPRKACDPGDDAGWINVSGTTIACIFTGDIWDDPKLLSAKQKCIFNISIDAVAFTRLLKAKKYVTAIETAKNSLSKAVAQIGKVAYPGKTTRDAKVVDDLKTSLSIIHSPNDALLTVVSSRRVLDALILKLGSSSAAALKLARGLAAIEEAIGLAIDTVTGVQDLKDCAVAFAGP
ncbi:hypothetical protein AB0L40_00590 [Patulibacter sp. NPDC049589]|uniref:hypothetical protein n=1 Tax=Patulibacter sp. NPDC049589 TaxID=3154731 RepID=UPI0034490CF2